MPTLRDGGVKQPKKKKVKQKNRIWYYDLSQKKNDIMIIAWHGVIPKKDLLHMP